MTFADIELIRTPSVIKLSLSSTFDIYIEPPKMTFLTDIEVIRIPYIFKLLSLLAFLSYV
jgi:hypothetical protein